MISKNLKKVAADSNVLLSAVIGMAALEILTHPEIEVITTHFNLMEIEEYLPRLAAKYGLDDKALLLQLKMLPVTVFKETDYQTHIPQAEKYLIDRDPDDIHLAALALKENIPIWSNDKDMKCLPLSVYSTAQLLKILEGKIG
jgi:predicted nucleic acid-binding protein